jgi:hypothetical protein
LIQGAVNASSAAWQQLDRLIRDELHQASEGDVAKGRQKPTRAAAGVKPRRPRAVQPQGRRGPR